MKNGEETSLSSIIGNIVFIFILIPTVITALEKLDLKGISEPEIVDDFLKKLNHPLKDVVEYLRTVILSADKSIGEGIYWNAPTFYYAGKMKPFEPKEYKRYIVGFNFYKQDSLRLIFLRDRCCRYKGLLTGDFKDKRKLASFQNIEQVKKAEADLVKIIKEVKDNKIRVIITSPYFTTSSSDIVSKQTGAKTLVLATSVGAFDQVKNYFDLFDERF